MALRFAGSHVSFVADRARLFCFGTYHCGGVCAPRDSGEAGECFPQLSSPEDRLQPRHRYCIDGCTSEKLKELKERPRENSDKCRQVFLKKTAEDVPRIQFDVA